MGVCRAIEQACAECFLRHGPVDVAPPVLSPAHPTPLGVRSALRSSVRHVAIPLAFDVIVLVFSWHVACRVWRPGGWASPQSLVVGRSNESQTGKAWWWQCWPPLKTSDRASSGDTQQHCGRPGGTHLCMGSRTCTRQGATHAPVKKEQEGLWEQKRVEGQGRAIERAPVRGARCHTGPPSTARKGTSSRAGYVGSLVLHRHQHQQHHHHIHQRTAHLTCSAGAWECHMAVGCRRELAGGRGWRWGHLWRWDRAEHFGMALWVGGGVRWSVLVQKRQLPGWWVAQWGRWPGS